ncbi:MAG: EAL domain-containing protein [Pseudomonadales bacterium]|nr:EAL domain-containing protein [Pseudomonadales bacterium]
MTFMELLKMVRKLDFRWEWGDRGEPETALYNELNLESVYQPIVSFTHQKIVGYEALIQPKRQDEIISVQSVFDLARALDENSVLDELCHSIHIKNFHHVGNPIWLFLNVNSQTVNSGVLNEAFIETTLAQSNLKQEQIVLEIVENGVEDLKTLKRFVDHAKALGFQIAMDNFGKGYANFDRIWQVEPQIVKLDQSLLQHAYVNKKARGLLKGLVDLIHKSQALVLIEGVENEELAEIALQSEADMFQGYFIGKPGLVPEPSSQILTRLGEMLQSYRHHQFENENFNNEALKMLHLEMMNACDKLAQSRDLKRACKHLKRLEPVRRCFLLDTSGHQIGETELAEHSAAKVSFNPLKSADGAFWSHREYFRNALSKSNVIHASKPYIALPDAENTITYSVQTYTRDGYVVLCVDADPDLLAHGHFPVTNLEGIY